MKKIISFCFLLLPLLGHAYKEYSVGDTLYVWALSGLSLRAAPSTDSLRKSVIPYGAALVIENHPTGFLQVKIMDPMPHEERKRWGFWTWSSIKDNCLELRPFHLKGHWVQVKYGNETGYVFDGYLSRLPAMKYVSKKKVGSNISYLKRENFVDYAAREFGLVEKTGYEKPETSNYQYTFRRGISFSGRSQENYSESCFVFNDITLEEGFLFFNVLWNSTIYPYDGYDLMADLKLTFHAENKVIWLNSELNTVEIQLIGASILAISISSG
ncbi:MAG: hypothetical protein AAFZ15_07045 [Bacteroidota bacterium]